MAAVATVSSCVPPTLPECDGYDAAVLVDMRCYIADLPNSTTARGTTSSGLPIQVTFHAARPPLLSHLCVHCPDLVLKSKPRVVATDADLVLLRVPIDPKVTSDIRYWDYFLYKPRSHRLDLLPNPHPRSFDDTATALLSREDGGWYAVAALSIRCPVHKRNSDVVVKWEFDLHLYRSDDVSKGWISKRMSVKEFVRDTLVPLPDAVDRLYHETGKTIVLGGERGTVAWVDLWRGLFLCDVLEEPPVLRDLPLPEPTRGNWSRLLQQWIPNCLRDITINRHKDTIKYIEMEIWKPRVVKTMPNSYLEWARHNNSCSQVIIPGGWKATTWTMAIPVGSFADWRPDCEVEVKDVTVDASDPHHSDLLSKLTSSNTLQELAYPTISMDDDVVYLLSRTTPRNMRKLELVVAIDLRKKIVQGVAELDVQKDFIFMPSYCTSEICRFLRKSTCKFSILVLITAYFCVLSSV